MKTIFFIFVAGVIVGGFAVMVWGIHWNTGSGSQTGYVSATETEGIVFKTNRAYIKPTLESTQEDVYCVTDTEVFTALQKAETEKRSISVKHYSLFVPGALLCKEEPAIIKAVE